MNSPVLWPTCLVFSSFLSSSIVFGGTDMVLVTFSADPTALPLLVGGIDIGRFVEGFLEFIGLL